MSTSKNPIEIEIQVQIENSQDLIQFLQNNATFAGESHQVDTYYQPTHKEFIATRPVKEWLRLRDSSGKYSINYKHWYYGKDGRSTHCDEYETKVESLEMLEKIFTALDVKELVKVDKVRKIWNYQEYEIALDSITGLGDFVEIEYKGEDNDNPTDITTEMIAFLKEHNVGKISRNYVGYPFQILFPKEVTYETF